MFQIVFSCLLITSVISIPVKRSTTPATCQVCHPVVKDKINVHLIPHSHDDVGWLKTVEQYYYGTKRNIQYAGVQFIISSSMDALVGHPDRRFVQVETAFFWKWWQHQDEAMKDVVRSLVNNGQLEIIGGAWSMNDEAASHYHSTIDQFTWGFKFLNESIGECARPKIGWQIDPFGHSREHASLMKQFGFEGLVIGRLDYRDKDRRKREKNLDFIWQGSTNLNNSNIFTSMFPDFYTSFNGFCFDVACSDEPINDNKASPDYNQNQKVSLFAQTLNKYKTIFKTSNMMVPMGGDFHYQAAEFNFGNIDKLVSGFEGHDTYHVFYSTPSCYMKAVHDEVLEKSITLEKKTDDFFPYASEEHSFWTGYFTSRPTSKRFERMGNNILQVMKHLSSFSKVNGKDTDSYLQDLREVMGIMQHHDAITGTEKQHVANDYTKMLTLAVHKAIEPSGQIIGDLLKIDLTKDVDLGLSLCLLSNVSICNISNSDQFLVTVYNPLSQAANFHVRLPIDKPFVYSIVGVDGEEPYDIFDSISSFAHVQEKTKPSSKELVFLAKDVPPFGLKAYYLEKDVVDDDYQELQELNQDEHFGTKENGFTVSESTRRLSSVTLRGITQEVTQNFWYYIGNCGSINGRVSGAYIFRPSNQEAQPISKRPSSVKYKKGILVDEVHQVFNDQVTQIIRVYKNVQHSYIEFDWLVGNLQTVNNRDGQEVITKYEFKDFSNQNTFYTDSNGREQIKRVLNTRSDYQYTATHEPVASNYYPVTAKIVIKDEDQNLAAAVLNDRAQGGSSLFNGTLELMLHRRLLKDDGYGVGEALKEDEYGKGLYVRGQHWLTFGPISPDNGDKSGAAYERILASQMLLRPLVFLSAANAITLEDMQKLINCRYKGLTRPLPNNVKILTLEPWRDNTFLLRLEHIFEKDEDDTLSQDVVVDLEGLFSGFYITDIGETTLGANQWLDDYENEEKLIWNDEKPIPWTKLDVQKPLKVTLHPMQIRTFLVKVARRNL